MPAAERQHLAGELDEDTARRKAALKTILLRSSQVAAKLTAIATSFLPDRFRAGTVGVKREERSPAVILGPSQVGVGERVADVHGWLIVSPRADSGQPLLGSAAFVLQSLGNVLLVRDLLKTLPGEVIRLVLLTGHYRQPVDWNDEVVSEARKKLDRLYGALRDLGDGHLEIKSMRAARDQRGRGTGAAILRHLDLDALVEAILATGAWWP